MMNDLRDFIKDVDQRGELRLVEDADWDIEIGSLTETVGATPNPPMLLFDSIKGYPKGYRIVTSVLGTVRRFALAMGFPEMRSEREMVEYWRRRLKEGFKPLSPVVVETGPVQENIERDEKIDLMKFPSPRWHVLDGGRYIGTGDAVVTRDPDDGWIDVGTFRVQVHDKNTATIWISPGKDADIIRRKYWARGQACPAVVVPGLHPLLFFVAGMRLPWGKSEYDYAGGMRGRAVEVINGMTTGLPIPADAEIALEGEIVPPEVETRQEGPFGEWTGYYASSIKPVAAFRVKTVYHRNDPIILGCAPLMDYRASYGGSLRRAALLWNELEAIVPGVKGVWLLEEAKGTYMLVISIKQMYPGHAKQVAMAAASGLTAAYHGRFIIVVDDDIDPFNTAEVLWAMATRCDPETQIDVVRGCWSTPLDPMISPEKRSQGNFTASRGLILACKPYHWIKEFPPSFKLSLEEQERTKKKWAWLFE